MPEHLWADAELENVIESYMPPDLIFQVLLLRPLALHQPSDQQGSSGSTGAACA